MKKFALALALLATGSAMAQTTNTGLNLSGLLGGGTVGLVVLAAIIFFVFRWWRGGGSDD